VHPLFAYLTTDKRFVRHGLRSAPAGEYHIGLATLPLHRRSSNNRSRGYRPGAKSTNLGGEHWQLEVVVGPFWTGGNAFVSAWRASARGLANRYAALKPLFDTYNNNGSTTHNSSFSREKNKGEALHMYCRSPRFTREVFERTLPNATKKRTSHFRTDEREARQHSTPSSSSSSSSQHASD
jgi:hypothetical protein